MTSNRRPATGVTGQQSGKAPQAIAIAHLHCRHRSRLRTLRRANQPTTQWHITHHLSRPSAAAS